MYIWGPQDAMLKSKINVYTIFKRGKLKSLLRRGGGVFVITISMNSEGAILSGRLSPAKF